MGAKKKQIKWSNPMVREKMGILEKRIQRAKRDYDVLLLSLSDRRVFIKQHCKHTTIVEGVGTHRRSNVCVVCGQAWGKRYKKLTPEKTKKN